FYPTISIGGGIGTHTLRIIDIYIGNPTESNCFTSSGVSSSSVKRARKGMSVFGQTLTSSPTI
ncbi:MAG: hypothetical protein KUA29_06935, partial [Methanobacterium sp.]|nr:hypothetical protein [Methanobacterium sp.]